MTLGHDLSLLMNGGASNRSSLSSEGFCENEDVAGEFLLPSVASVILGASKCDLDPATCSSSTPKGSSTLTPSGVSDPEALNGEKSSSPEDADSDWSGPRDGASQAPDGGSTSSSPKSDERVPSGEEYHVYYFNSQGKSSSPERNRDLKTPDDDCLAVQVKKTEDPFEVRCWNAKGGFGELNLLKLLILRSTLTAAMGLGAHACKQRERAYPGIQ